jgi:hypothetical protein
MSEELEIHENCDCVVVHPTGQLQNIRECWCKVYHVFGKNIQKDQTIDVHVNEDIFCYYLKNGQSQNLPPNMYLERKLKLKIFGPGIFYRKGSDLSLDKAKLILTT